MSNIIIETPGPKSKSQSEQPATCPICSATIRQSRNLRRHLELRHFKKKTPKKLRQQQKEMAANGKIDNISCVLIDQGLLTFYLYLKLKQNSQILQLKLLTMEMKITQSQLQWNLGQTNKQLPLMDNQQDNNMS
jgi:hypothetical protein